VLVLTRKLEESVVIDERIVVTVLEVHGDRVKLGIEAPRDIGIVRSELLLQIKEINEAAAIGSPDASTKVKQALRGALTRR